MYAIIAHWNNGVPRQKKQYFNHSNCWWGSYRFGWVLFSFSYVSRVNISDTFVWIDVMRTVYTEKEEERVRKRQRTVGLLFTFIAIPVLWYIRFNVSLYSHSTLFFFCCLSVCVCACVWVLLATLVKNKYSVLYAWHDVTAEKRDNTQCFSVLNLHLLPKSVFIHIRHW